MKITYQPTLVPGCERAITLNYTDDGSPARSITMLNVSLAIAIDPTTKAVTATLVKVDGDGQPVSDTNGEVQESATDPSSQDAAIQAAALALGPRVLPSPAITSLAPNTGPPGGGTAVVIQGRNLTGTTAVMFGANPATSFTVDSAFQLTAVAPAQAEGLVDVVVTAPGGSATQKQGFTYK